MVLGEEPGPGYKDNSVENVDKINTSSKNSSIKENEIKNNSNSIKSQNSEDSFLLPPKKIQNVVINGKKVSTPVLSSISSTNFSDSEDEENTLGISQKTPKKIMSHLQSRPLSGNKELKNLGTTLSVAPKRLLSPESRTKSPTSPSQNPYFNLTNVIFSKEFKHEKNSLDFSNENNRNKNRKNREKTKNDKKKDGKNESDSSQQSDSENEKLYIDIGNHCGNDDTADNNNLIIRSISGKLIKQNIFEKLENTVQNNKIQMIPKSLRKSRSREELSNMNILNTDFSPESLNFKSVSAIQTDLSLNGFSNQNPLKLIGQNSFDNDGNKLNGNNIDEIKLISLTIDKKTISDQITELRLQDEELNCREKELINRENILFDRENILLDRENILLDRENVVQEKENILTAREIFFDLKVKEWTMKINEFDSFQARSRKGSIIKLAATSLSQRYVQF